MNMRFITLIFSFICLIAVHHARASDFPHFEMRKEPWADNQYTHLINMAKYTPYNEKFPFFELRNMYARSAHYVPHAENVKEQMLRLIFKIENLKDPVQIDELLSRYHDLAESHWGNIAVLSFAIEQAKKDERYGDDAILSWLYKGLVKSLTLEPRGTSIKDAYRVITFDEEQFLFDYLDVQKIKTRLINASDAYLYHAHLVHKNNDSADDNFEIYVDATYPLHAIEQMRITGNPYDTNWRR